MDAGGGNCPHDLHVIPQHELLGIRMQVHLLVHPVGHRVAVQVMLQQRQGNDQLILLVFLSIYVQHTPNSRCQRI